MNNRESEGRPEVLMCGVRERPRSKKGVIITTDEKSPGATKTHKTRKKSAMEVVKIRISDSQGIRKMD